MLGGILLKRIKGFQIAGFIFTAAAGTLLHFVFEWLGSPVYAAAFSAVNESVWEHVRLLMIPFLLFTLLEFIVYGRYVQNFAPVKCVSLLLGMLIIIAGYYTYIGAFGENLQVVNILLFVIAVAVAYIYSYTKMGGIAFRSSTGAVLGALGLLILAALAVALTYYPPHIPLFQDPMNGTYGF